MYPQLSLEEVRLADDEAGEHLGLYKEQLLVTVISLFERQGQVQFRKFATLPQFQRKGYGTTLLQHVFHLAQEKNASSIWCNARLTAVELYRRFGMRPLGSTWLQHGHQFIKMQKDFVKNGNNTGN